MKPTKENKPTETAKLTAAVSSLLHQNKLQYQTIVRLNEQMRYLQQRVALLEQTIRR